MSPDRKRVEMADRAVADVLSEDEMSRRAMAVEDAVPVAQPARTVVHEDAGDGMPYIEVLPDQPVAQPEGLSEDEVDRYEVAEAEVAALRERQERLVEVLERAKSVLFDWSATEPFDEVYRSICAVLPDAPTRRTTAGRRAVMAGGHDPVDLYTVAFTGWLPPERRRGVAPMVARMMGELRAYGMVDAGASGGPPRDVARGLNAYDPEDGE